MVVEGLETAAGVAGWQIRTKNLGISQETMLTLIRNWLRLEEDRYHDEFKERG